MSDGYHKPVPALVVSGFLGSGKTTLVRHLLDDAQRSGERVAVISNEFGELGIDQALLGDGGEAFVELEGGCVCCQLSDELVDTLEMLRERVNPDRVIVETSGVALPYDTQLNFYRDPVSSWIGDDVALVVVDAEQLVAGRDLEGTFEDQVTSADLLVLNKIDLVPEASLDLAEARLRELEPDAPIVRALRGEVDPLLLFPPDASGARGRRRAGAGEPSSHQHEVFETETLLFEAGLSEAELESRIQEHGALRAKGFVHTEAGLRLVQGVGVRIEFLEVAKPPPAELHGRIVLIRRSESAARTHRVKADG